MSTRACRTLIWLLIAQLALISGLGEGLHLLPGCGHYAKSPAGCLWLGGPRSSTTGSDGPVRACRSQPPHAPPSLLLNECPICSLLAETQRPSQGIAFLAAPETVAITPLAQAPLSSLDASRAFRARAPPA